MSVKVLLKNHVWLFLEKNIVYTVVFNYSVPTISALLYGSQIGNHPRHIGCIDPNCDVLEVARGESINRIASDSFTRVGSVMAYPSEQFFSHAQMSQHSMHVSQYYGEPLCDLFRTVKLCTAILLN